MTSFRKGTHHSLGIIYKATTLKLTRVPENCKSMKCVPNWCICCCESMYLVCCRYLYNRLSGGNIRCHLILNLRWGYSYRSTLIVKCVWVHQIWSSLFCLNAEAPNWGLSFTIILRNSYVTLTVKYVLNITFQIRIIIKKNICIIRHK